MAKSTSALLGDVSQSAMILLSACASIPQCDHSVVWPGHETYQCTVTFKGFK